MQPETIVIPDSITHQLTYVLHLNNKIKSFLEKHKLINPNIIIDIQYLIFFLQNNDYLTIFVYLVPYQTKNKII